MTLRQVIEREIEERGPMLFSRYMELCLYHPELGYYARSAGQFGKAGDFYTSSDVHAVFGRLWARQFEEMWRLLGSPSRIELLELGPGRGLFAQDVLDWSEKKFPEFFAALHYSLQESSPALRERMLKTLDRHFSAGRVSFVELQVQQAGERFAHPTIVFANEFFDALPVEIVSPAGELRISAQDGRFLETWAPASRAAVHYLDRYSVQPEASERLETALVAQAETARIAGAVQTGFLAVVDYGYTRAEQLAMRHRGTLMTYRRHSARGTPYDAPGEQDITAHVNFTALSAAAEQQGMLLQPLRTQSQFLLGIGERNQFADAFEECRLPQERAKVALQLKHLITPEGMGESFQVLVASKGVEADKANALAGLSFGRK